MPIEIIDLSAIPPQPTPHKVMQEMLTNTTAELRDQFPAQEVAMYMCAQGMGIYIELYGYSGALFMLMETMRGLTHQSFKAPGPEWTQTQMQKLVAKGK